MCMCPWGLLNYQQKGDKASASPIRHHCGIPQNGFQLRRSINADCNLNCVTPWDRFEQASNRVHCCWKLQLKTTLTRSTASLHFLLLLAFWQLPLPCSPPAVSLHLMAVLLGLLFEGHACSQASSSGEDQRLWVCSLVELCTVAVYMPHLRLHAYTSVY